MRPDGPRRPRRCGRSARRFAPAALLAVLVTGTAAAEEDGGSVWQGEYTCGQGKTGLTLTIDPAGAEGPGAAQALFEFYAVNGNAGVPDGCFEMSGTVDPATGQVELAATRWLRRPAGYVTVDLSGRISDGQSMKGRVIGPFCTRFALRRVAPPRVAPRLACRGQDTVASAR